MSQTVLVVDDAVFVRRLLRDVLGRAGYRVFEAVNGPDAIEKYAESRPDLVTLDLGMPGMNGLDVLRRIRMLDPHARVVIVSAARSQAIMSETSEHGACAYVRKPFQPQTVLDVVRTSLLVPPVTR